MIRFLVRFYVILAVFTLGYGILHRDKVPVVANHPVSTPMDKSVKVASFLDEVYLSHGTGVFLDENGTILTQAHVLGDGNDIRVLLPDATDFIHAVLISSDNTKDLAIVKTSLLSKAVVLWEDFKRGDTVYAIGSPVDGDFHTIPTQIIAVGFANVNGQGRKMIFVDYKDGKIGPGFSGGGIFDIQGQMLGSIEICSNGHGVCGAIPSSVLKDYVLKNKKK